MPIKKIARAQIMLPTTQGSLVAQMALTKQASATIEGEVLANRVYLAGTLKGYWNPNQAYPAVVRVNGVVTDCNVTSLSNDNIEVGSGGVVNINGSVVSVSADATNAVTRPATGKYAVYALTVSTAGSTAITKGTDGDSVDLTGGYGGAGQKPLVATNVAVLRYFVAYSDTAGVISVANIYPGESANIAYRIDYIRGGIILDTALEANHTGPVERGVYASFYAQESDLQAVAELQTASLTTTVEIAETTSQSSKWKKRTPIGLCDWSIAVEKWAVDNYIVDKVLNPLDPEVVVKFKMDSGDAYHFKGAGIAQGINLSLARGPQKEPFTIVGNGELIRAND